MKILSAAQISWLDQYTIAHEPIASIDLMERAAAAFTQAFLSVAKPKSEQRIFVFCGIGNNGGDGFAIARKLEEAGKNVFCFAVNTNAPLSQDCAVNKERLESIHLIKTVSSEDDIPEIDTNVLIIDALFGSGLNRPLEGLWASVVSYINASKATIYSVDIPSGLYSDKMPEENSSIVQACTTFTFHAPKLVFMLPQFECYVGKWQVLNIGLSEEGTEQITSPHYFTTHNSLDFLLKEPSAFSHKGVFGHALITAGSYGMIGAAVLCTKAALRSGCGLVSVAAPAIGYAILQTSTPEAMVLNASKKDTVSCPDDISAFDAVAIGPGVGKSLKTQAELQTLLHKKPNCLVLDADALNIFAQQKELLKFLPENSILTPHPGEFKRLAGEWKNDFEKLQLLKDFAAENKVIVVLKGAHTAIATPNGNLHFNSTGNPGMAKGGSGDILTGVIVSLLAQKYTPLQAALAGVYIHGLAGDFALAENGRFGMTATDIIHQLPIAFKEFTT